MYEKIFPADALSRRERGERTLNRQPVDRTVSLTVRNLDARALVLEKTFEKP